MLKSKTPLPPLRVKIPSSSLRTKTRTTPPSSNGAGGSGERRPCKRSLFRFSRSNKPKNDQAHNDEQLAPIPQEEKSSDLISRIRTVVPSASSGEESWEYNPNMGQVALKKNKDPSHRLLLIHAEDKDAQMKTEGLSPLTKSIDTKRSSSTETNTTTSTNEDNSQWSCPSASSSRAGSHNVSDCSQTGVEILPYSCAPKACSGNIHSSSSPLSSRPNCQPSANAANNNDNFSSTSCTSTKETSKIGIGLDDALASMNGLKETTRHQRILDSLASQDETFTTSKSGHMLSIDDTYTTRSEMTESEFHAKDGVSTSFPFVSSKNATKWKKKYICGLPICGMYNEADLFSYVVKEEDEGEDDVDVGVDVNHHDEEYTSDSDDDFSSDSDSEHFL